MGAVYALPGTIVAEFLGAQAGIGVTITQLQSVSDVAGVFACLIVLGVTGILLDLGMRALERQVVHWTDRSRSQIGIPFRELPFSERRISEPLTEHKDSMGEGGKP